jgi:hypothetical protein
MAMMTDAAATPLPPLVRTAYQCTIAIVAIFMFWIEVRGVLRTRLCCHGPRYSSQARVQIDKTQKIPATASSEQEVRPCWLSTKRALRLGAPESGPPAPPQVCNIICARLDTSALGALLNVLVFFIKQVVNTAVYRHQLAVIKTRPLIQYDARLDRDELPAAAALPGVAMSPVAGPPASVAVSI